MLPGYLSAQSTSTALTFVTSDIPCAPELGNNTSNHQL
jgi:hypothetical protein